MRANFLASGAAALLFAVVGFSVTGQAPGVANGGFEQGTLGSPPPGWFVPPLVTQAGYQVALSEGAHEGKQCAVISGGGGNGFGNIMQSVEPGAYRGKSVRFRAAVRFEAAGGFGQAQLWLRIDRANGQPGFFYNMGDRPIRSGSWAFYEIVGAVASDAESINFGMLMAGTGRASIDSASLSLSDAPVPVAGGPRALTARGLDNVTAFARLLGYIRHFHPSDAVEKADWNALAIAGIADAEEAKDPADLAQRLDAFFRPIAPTVRVYSRARPDLPPGLKPPADKTGLQSVAWENIGFGGGTNQNGGIYRSRRVFSDNPPAALPAPFEADLGGGVSCVIPLTLYATAGSALPATATPRAAAASGPLSADDRNTRLAAVALGWNVFQHFYPYFDVVKVDWNAVLRTSLSSAAMDADARAFLTTLRKLVASAEDGHGYVAHVSDGNSATPPISADWVDGSLIVTQVGPGLTKPRQGDEILQIDGKKVADLWKQLEPTISGATSQWRRYRARREILAGPEGSSVTIQFVRGTAEPYEMPFTRTSQALAEPKPKPIEEIRPGIWYVDLDGPRAKMEDYKAALPDLAKAKGIVFDMRGYPNEVAMDVIQRCGAQPVISASWNVPKIAKPDHQGIEFLKSNWPPAGPLDPRFVGKIAFITDGRAISYAESIMGIVENYKLGEIVGAPTAGTNGNINPFSLPGGYTVIFTGMKVVKHDGSTHHGVGIQPTVKVSRTTAGIAAKKDELLDRAIAAVGG